MKISINGHMLTKAEIRSLRAMLVHFFRTQSDLIAHSPTELFFMQRTVGLQVLDVIDNRTIKGMHAYTQVVRHKELTDCNEAHILCERDQFLFPVPFAMVTRLAVSNRLPKALMTDHVRTLRKLLITGYTE